MRHFDTNVLGTLLSLKHELRVMTAQKKAQSSYLLDYGHEGAAMPLFIPRANMRSRASPGRPRSKWPRPAFASRGGPGPTDTGMLDRFNRDAREQEALIGGVRSAELARPDDIANAVLFLAPMPPSS